MQPVNTLSPRTYFPLDWSHLPRVTQLQPYVDTIENCLVRIKKILQQFLSSVFCFFDKTTSIQLALYEELSNLTTSRSVTLFSMPGTASRFKDILDLYKSRREGLLGPFVFSNVGHAEFKRRVLVIWERPENFLMRQCISELCGMDVVLETFLTDIPDDPRLNSVIEATKLIAENVHPAQKYIDLMMRHYKSSDQMAFACMLRFYDETPIDIRLNGVPYVLAKWDMLTLNKRLCITRNYLNDQTLPPFTRAEFEDELKRDPRKLYEITSFVDIQSLRSP